jgi:hypothetical protein
MLLKCAQIAIQFHIILNLLLQQFVSDSFYLENLRFMVEVLKTIVCLALVYKAAGKIRIMTYFQILWRKENK